MSGELRGTNLSIAEETKVVALLARGDTYDQIKTEIQTTFGRGIQTKTITNIKRRNMDNLSRIRKHVLAIEEANTIRIKNKLNNIIEKRVDNEYIAAELLTAAAQRFVAGEINHVEYLKLVKSVKTSSLTELASVSKEMNAQSSNTPPEQTDPEHMAKLAAALKDGDEITLAKLVFKRGRTEADT